MAPVGSPVTTSAPGRNFQRLMMLPYEIVKLGSLPAASGLRGKPRLNMLTGLVKYLQRPARPWCARVETQAHTRWRTGWAQSDYQQGYAYAIPPSPAGPEPGACVSRGNPGTFPYEIRQGAAIFLPKMAGCPGHTDAEARHGSFCHLQFAFDRTAPGMLGKSSS